MADTLIAPTNEIVHPFSSVRSSNISEHQGSDRLWWLRNKLVREPPGRLLLIGIPK